MSNIAISVENLSKRYRIGLAQKRPKSLREAISSSFGMPFHYLRTRLRDPRPEEIVWALNDVSFDVKHGEVFGIIGRNGAGKSTLLKILSRITEPTRGRANIYGRIGSLLEVGTGFHPELTGRENIYLNGAILGMRRAEIARNFDEIVNFADVEKFIDTPVKKYSSGMYVRLAFAVAAYLQQEILLIDEVLAVGDIKFQKKCLGKMKHVSQEGRTVLFVSHNMPFITTLCDRGILLKDGKVATIGATSDVVMAYYTDEDSCPYAVDFSNHQEKIGNDYAMLLSGSIQNETGQKTSEIYIHEAVKVVMRYNILKQVPLKFVPNFHFYRGDGSCAFVSHSHVASIVPPGEYIAECHIPGNFLNEDVYFVGLALSSYEPEFKIWFHEPNVLSFNVRDPIDGTITRNGYRGPYPGNVRPLLEWRIFNAKEQ